MFWQVISGFDASLLVTFVLAGLILNITPGADFVFVTANSVAAGAKRGIAAAIGINAGIVVHVAAAAAGLSALFVTYPAAYVAIRYAGAMYLLYLAYQAWTAKAANANAEAESSFGRTVSRGFLTNVLNPKTALFIFAFIPQFTDPAIGPIWMQILFLGLVFMVNGFLFTLCLALTAGTLSRGLRTHSAFLNKLTALIFGGLAARLILD